MPVRIEGKLVLASLFWLLCGVESAAQISFQTEVVRDLDSTVGRNTSIAVTAEGIPHISFTSISTLYHTSPVDGVWQFRELSTNYGAPQLVTSIDLDSQDKPHIANHAHNLHVNQGVLYSWRVGSHWNWDWVENTPTEGHQLGQRMSMVLDSQDIGHIVYHYGQFGEHRYATNASGSWVIEVITDASNSSPDIGVDKFNDPRIAYLGSSDHQGSFHAIRYGDRSNGSWAISTVTGTYLAQDLALAVDPDGIPHISFYDSSTGDLKYASWDLFGSWVITTVLSIGDVGKESDIALDSQGEPHISCYDVGLGNLRYVYRTGGVWYSLVVDDNTDVGRHNSIAVDAGGGVHISYQDVTLEALKYANWLDCNDNGTHDAVDIATGVARDCNGNGVPDHCDIANGTSLDCGGDLIPDECQLADGSATDCNNNGVPDICDQFEGGVSEDCNNNNIPDECDISSGVSADCNGNGIPDSCDSSSENVDCDGNGIPDGCDIAAGEPDCNGNGVLDRCEFGLTEIWPPDYDDIHFGLTVTSGDFNDDGLSDMVIGAPSVGANTWGAVEGAAYVFFGPNPSFSPIPELTISGSVPDALGRALAMGDVNDDGIDDLVVGSPYGSYQGSDYLGRIDVFLGSSGFSNVPSFSIGSPFESGYPEFGFSVAVVDVNGDGHGDFVVGAPVAESERGKVHVFLSNPVQTTPHHTWSGEALGDLFGSAVANAGDVDGNGLDDIIVGAYGNNTGGTDAGKAYLFLSQPGGTFSNGPVLVGEASGDELGKSVSGAGDFNNDSYADVLIGAESHDGADIQTGRVYMLLGGPLLDGTADIVFDAPFELNDRLSHFGSSVNTAGDLNGDGISDILIGADHNATDLGSALVYFGAENPDTSPDLAFRSSNQLQAGYAVSPAGDTDGDGAFEFLIGAPRYRGGAYLLEMLMPGAGDCNGNGIADMCDISNGTSQDFNQNGLPDECGDVSAVGGPVPKLETRLLGAFPTPFNPRTEIRFELANSTDVNLEVFDVSGRLVRTLISGVPYAAGLHMVPWKGRDDSGRKLSSGIYLYRLSTGQYSATRRVVLLK